MFYKLICGWCPAHFEKSREKKTQNDVPSWYNMYTKPFLMPFLYSKADLQSKFDFILDTWPPTNAGAIPIHEQHWKIGNEWK